MDAIHPKFPDEDSDGALQVASHWGSLMAHSPLAEQGGVSTDQATPMPHSRSEQRRRIPRGLRTDAVRSFVLSLAPFRGGASGKGVEALDLARVSLDPQGSPKESSTAQISWRSAFQTPEGSLKTPGRSGRRKKGSQRPLHSPDGPRTPQGAILDEQAGLSPGALWRWFDRPGSAPGSPRGHRSRRSPGTRLPSRQEESADGHATAGCLSQPNESVPTSWSRLRMSRGGDQSMPADREPDKPLDGRGPLEEPTRQAAPGESHMLDPGQGSTARLTIDTFDVRLLGFPILANVTLSCRRRCLTVNYSARRWWVTGATDTAVSCASRRPWMMF